MKKRQKHAGLAHLNGCGLTFFHMMLGLVKGTTKPNNLLLIG
jgi:hypothetical protein